MAFRKGVLIDRADLEAKRVHRNPFRRWCTQYCKFSPGEGVNGVKVAL